MSAVPSKAVQHRFIQNLQKEITKHADLWEYAVSTKWVSIVQQFFITDGDPPGEIPPMFASDWDQENIYVSENSWKVLASWYGVDKLYSCRRRSTMSSYVNVYGTTSLASGDHQGGNDYILADHRLDFLTIFCCLLQDLSSDRVKQPYITIYFWDSLDYIEFQLRCALKIHPRHDVRMWLSFCDDCAEVFLKNITTVRDTHTTMGSIICASYPDVLEVLKRRQTLPAGDLSYGGAASMGARGLIKEELRDVFVANQWQVTLCLEQLPSTVGTSTDVQLACLSKVPSAFHNVCLDHLFHTDSKNFFLDDKLKQVLDDSEQEFRHLIRGQKSKLEERVQELLKEVQENYEVKEKALKTKLEEVALLESQLSSREKELNERDHELNSKLAKFKSMLTEFLTKKDKFEKEAVKMAEQNKITSSRVELNVGGVRYTTSLSTLTKEEGSLLQAMFRGQHSITPDTDGSYFIDRDGTNFRYVLNFLRDGPASLHNMAGTDQRLLSELRVEAEHYQLSKMADILHAMMSGAHKHGAYASMPP